MVYPEECKDEIAKIEKLTNIYRETHIHVPGIKDTLADRIILQEDLGDLLAQKAFSLVKLAERKRLLEKVADILVKLKGIPCAHTASILDTARMKWEMDFFLTHFAPHYLPAVKDSETTNDLRQRLYRMVDRISPIDTFAHRDFHSRNMLIHKNEIYLVDFQDSLIAPPFYDLVSFAFDSYLDLKSRGDFFIRCLEDRGMAIDWEPLYITALQRNIKALGTFGYQVTVRKNLSYKKYIHRTIRHIVANKLLDRFLPRSLFSG